MSPIGAADPIALFGALLFRGFDLKPLSKSAPLRVEARQLPDSAAQSRALLHAGVKVRRSVTTRLGALADTPGHVRRRDAFNHQQRLPKYFTSVTTRSATAIPQRSCRIRTGQRHLRDAPLPERRRVRSLIHGRAACNAIYPPDRKMANRSFRCAEPHQPLVIKPFPSTGVSQSTWMLSTYWSRSARKTFTCGYCSRASKVERFGYTS
jgi:hypothetical protein